jgi:hypothetical protein
LLVFSFLHKAIFSNWGEATNGCESNIKLVEFSGISSCVIAAIRDWINASGSGDCLDERVGFIAVVESGETSHNLEKGEGEEVFTSPPKVEV